MILIDRTDKAWRKANPELAEPEEHPERVVKIWLDELKFDLDQSRIESKGSLRVQAAEAEIEGEGLTLAWNERDNRVEELIIEKGHFMELRRGGGMVSFDMPGRERESTQAAETVEQEPVKPKRTMTETLAMVAAGVSVPEQGREPSEFVRRAVATGASANQAVSIDDVFPKKTVSTGVPKRSGEFTDKPARPRRKISLFGKDTGAPIRPKKGQIDTYLAVFEKDVVVEQRRGLKMLGRLSGVERLALVFDVGDQQRRSLRSDQATSRPAEAEAEEAKAKGAAQKSAATVNARASTSQPTTTAKAEEETRLRLSWNGRLVLRPVQPEGKPTGKQFDAWAIGEEVRIEDKQGQVVCERLIFSNETEQAWLYGSSKSPVRMWSGKTRRLQGEKIYIDRKTGIALFDGPGHMADTRKALAAVSVPGEGEEAVEGAADDQERVELNWSKGCQLEFGLAKVTYTDPATGREIVKAREHVKQASFRGDVTMRQGDQVIRADDVVLKLGPPTDRKAFVGPILSVRATGGISLDQQDNKIKADKLSVTMTVDEHGRNLPESASAYGNVLAKQGDRHIRARDLLSVVIGEPRAGATTQASPGSVTERLTPESLAKIKEQALLLGVMPRDIDALLARKDLSVAVVRSFAASKGVPENYVNRLVKLLRPPKPKSELAIVEMHAFGDVVAVDEDQKMDVQAEELHCTIPDGKMIDRATVVAKPGQQSRVMLSDYVIHGHRIEVDLPKHFAEVPDKGWLRFVSRQGLDGRKVENPVPIKVQWSKEMRLEGQRNVGWFIGDVVAESQNKESDYSRLECDRLRIDFVDLPPMLAQKAKKKKPQAKSKLQLLEELIFHRGKSERESESPQNQLAQRFDKKPVRVLAEGNVVVLSSRVDRDNPKMLLSRMRMAGPKLTVDLRTEQLDITGAGSLLIEDYRLPQAAQKNLAAIRKRPSRPKDPLMGDLSGRGPSQTVFTWANSMTYFLENNLAVLDRSVSMIHLEGRSMVLGEDLAQAMDVDIAKLPMNQRKSALTCENLTVEFLRTQSSGRRDRSPLDAAGSAELKRLIATGNIYLEDGGRSLVGEELTYFRDRNVITVRGTSGNHARIFMEEGGRVMREVGPLIRWNRSTGEIYIPQARAESVSQ